MLARTQYSHQTSSPALGSQIAFEDKLFDQNLWTLKATKVARYFHNSRASSTVAALNFPLHLMKLMLIDG
jgi:hypothetical protein